MAKRAQRLRDWDDSALRSFPTSRRYLVGVSGGRDSVVLLHWLLARGYQKLIVCHLDHQLRGRSARADARFVARLAKRHDLAFEEGVSVVRKIAATAKQSVETAARSARYAFFAAVGRRRRCPTIFLGHHADDLVETFLFNLFRGAGPRGQGSIREVSKRQIEKVELTIVRPLLGVWRAEIDAYIAAHALRFREDASNERLDALRNRMRHRIIPSIEREFGRGIRKALWRAAVIAAEEDAVLEEMLPEQSAKLPVGELRAMPVALQRRAIARWLRAHPVSDIGFDMVEEVRALLEANNGPAKVNLTGDSHARRRAGKLFIEKPAR